MIASIRERPLVIAALLICAAHVGAALLLGANPLGSAASNLLQMGAAAVAGLQCLRVSRSATAFARRFWTLVAVAFGIWSGGQAFYAYHENWLAVSVPSPSWSHFLFRLYGAPLLMALLIGSEEEENGRALDWQRILDFAQVGILFLFFYFDLYFTTDGEWRNLTGLSILGFLELSDLENWLLGVAFAARGLLSRRIEERTLSRQIVPYLLCYAASSSFYNYAYSFWNPRTGEWPDLVFTLSLTLGSLLAATWQPNASEPSPSTGPGAVVNWAPAVLPLLTLGLALPLARNEPRVAFVAIFGAVACFGGRLVITQYRRERLLEALRASEARYASLLRLAPDAIFVHVGGRVTFANPATARILGFDSPEDLIGRHLLDFVPPENRGALAERIANGGSTTASPAQRLVCVRRDGVRVPIDAVGTTLERVPGEPEPTARLLIARDVTDREQAEGEREALIQQLEAKNSELERFTYTVSHDLRSPLITITGFLSHVEAAGASGDLRAMRADLERIRRAARKMDRLLSDLLELSRIGHVLGSREPVPFEAICREAIDLTHGRLMARGITVEIEPDLPVIHGDRARLVEVVQNLLDNSAKFMGDQKAPRLRIGAIREQGETVLFVRDNGIGIDPRHHERVFGLFDRLDAKAEGTGVGLALVKRIIELHGGRIWVESAGGGSGATFCLTLPAGPDSPTGAG